MSNWKITYVGEGVTALDGVGVFARHTTARVAEGVATKLKGDPKWLVTSPEGATTGTAPKAEKPPEPKAEAKREEPKAEATKEEPKAEAKKEEPKAEKPAEKK